MKVTPQFIREILEEPFWPDTLKVNQTYSRLHDHTEGENCGRISVTVGQDGDVWTQSDTEHCLRFRTEYGGGRSQRTRNALLILAEAMRLDDLEKPDPE